ncbi:uncharacterized protein V6R79_008289 [Siganus canaliculatus]
MRTASVENDSLEMRTLVNISRGEISTGPHVRRTAKEREREALGLVDVDSVYQLCEELLHPPGTQIQCATSDK